MTDAKDGSATVLEPNAGSPPAANGGSDQGSNGNAADPLAGLETGSREWAEKNGVKSIADAITAAREAQSLIGKSVQLPGDDAKDEDWTKVFARLGRPETPDGYEIPRPDALPEDAFQADAKALKEIAHKAGLTPRQVKAVGEFIFGAAATNLQAQAEQTRAAAVAATTELEKEFGGASSSDAFKGAMHLAGRALAEMGGKEIMDDLRAAGLVSDDGHILNARIAKAFWNVGKALYREDGLHRGDPASGAENPFKDGPDKGNMTEQSRLIKADPVKAKTLMREAGRKPSEWNLAD